MAKRRLGKKYAYRNAKWRDSISKLPGPRPGGKWGFAGASTRTSKGESRHQSRQKNDFRLHKPEFYGPSRPVDETESEDTWNLIADLAIKAPTYKDIETTEIEDSRPLYPNGNPPWVNRTLDNIQEHIIANSKRDISSLLNFRGNMTWGQGLARLNTFCAAMELGIRDFTQITRLVDKSPHLIHTNGLHKKQWSKMSIQTFASRLIISKELTKRISGFYDFLQFLFARNQTRPYILESLMRETRDYRSIKRKPWRHLAEPKRREHKSLLEYYPFVRSSEPMPEGSDLLLAVHELVPNGINEQIRGDLCQELLVKILEGKLSIKDVRDNLSVQLKQARKENRYINHHHLSYLTTDDTLLRCGNAIRNWRDLISEVNYASSQYQCTERASAERSSNEYDAFHSDDEREDYYTIIEETQSYQWAPSNPRLTDEPS